MYQVDGAVEVSGVDVLGMQHDQEEIIGIAADLAHRWDEREREMILRVRADVLTMTKRLIDQVNATVKTLDQWIDGDAFENRGHLTIKVRARTANERLLEAKRKRQRPLAVRSA